MSLFGSYIFCESVFLLLTSSVLFKCTRIHSILLHFILLLFLETCLLSTERQKELDQIRREWGNREV